MARTQEEKELGIRGQVAKYQHLFEGYIKEYGSARVKRVLEKGRDGDLVLKLPMNYKDRKQMIQLLGL